jgi:drug/metabolite transporter (DMT)-like permease
MTFFQTAIVYAKASTVAILFSCNAVFMIPFAALFLGEKLTKLSLLSLGISLSGILFIVNPDGRKGSLRFSYDGVIQSSFSFLAGSLELLVLMLLTKIDAVSHWLTNIGLGVFSHVPVVAGISWSTLPLLFYLGVCVTGLGFSFYFLAMEETSASTASMVFFIKPAQAPILALLIHGEAITPNVLFGIVQILAGSCITFISDSREAKLAKLAQAGASEEHAADIQKAHVR